MKTKAIIGFLACVAVAILSSGAWALDEAILTPTNDSVKAAEEEALLFRDTPVPKPPDTLTGKEGKAPVKRKNMNSVFREACSRNRPVHHFGNATNWTVSAPL